MLLPLPAALVHDISLENHLALATMRSGHGTPDTMVTLMRILYGVFFMLDTRCSDDDLALLLEVEASLDRSIRAAAQGRDWQLPVECLAIKRVLLRFDEVVSSVSKHRYIEARERLNRFAGSVAQPPLPGSLIKDLWQ